jgi:hypothetical protein
MKRIVTVTCLAAAAVLGACSSDSSTTNTGSAALLDASSAYTTVPPGFSDLSTSFAAAETDGPFSPLFDGRGPLGRFLFGHGAGFGIGFMGGLGQPFLGFGLGLIMRGDACTSASTGVVTCAKEEHDGLTVTRTYLLTDASGTPQSKFDNTTNTIVSTFSVTGTVTRHDGNQTAVNESSSETISGLAQGSTQRKVDGISAGSENTTGTSSMGAFTAQRLAGDTIVGVVIPVGTAALSHPPYPTAGTIRRGMKVTMTLSGQAPAISTREEVITYDGSATAKVVITEDGNTQNCTLPLPFGRLSCQ